MEIKISEKKMRMQSIRENINTVKAVNYTDVKVKEAPREHVSDSVSRLESAEQELMESAAELEEKKIEIMKRVHRISRPEYVEMLYLRYVEMMSREVIVENMFCSIRHLFKMHRKALTVFAKANKDLFVSKNGKIIIDIRGRIRYNKTIKRERIKADARRKQKTKKAR